MSAPPGEGLGEPEQAHTRGALPAFVGRARELSAIAALLRSQPLVTITGPGGVGKTRLALELVRGDAPSTREVHFVDLAAAGRSANVMEEIARAMGVATGPKRLASALRAYLAERRVLLVLDNCEHVLELCAAAVAELQESAPLLRVLSTSREPLGLAAEVVWRLEPLEEDEASRLFIARGRQHSPDFLPDRETEETIEGLCERLDRLPLAIELAAAQLPVMTPAEIVARIDERLALPAMPRALAPSRHGTLERVIAWSYQLLDPEAQAGFRRMAVFASSFDAVAALDVALDGSIGLLARLVHKSLLTATSAGQVTRYRLLATIREFALLELERAGEVEELRARLLQHYLAIGEQARSEWLATGSDLLVHRLDPDYENVRAALKWSAEHQPCAGMRLFGATRNLFFRLDQAGGLRVGQILIQECPAHDSFRLDALIGVGQLASTLMDHRTAREALAHADRLAGELGDPVRSAWVAFFRGLAESLAGDPGGAAEFLQRSLELHRTLGIELGQARALAVLGVGAFAAGEHTRAIGLLEQALALYRAHDDVWGQGQCLAFLGLSTAASAANPIRATPLFREAIALLMPLHDATILPIALLGQAALRLPSDRAAAIRVAAAACAERERVGGRFPPFLADQIGQLREASDRVTDGRRLWADGARLDVVAAVALAFEERQPVRQLPGGLSSRELEVVRLLSSGMANKQIAGRLHLSVRTVESHVRNALSKLGLENRTQLATWAREQIR